MAKRVKVTFTVDESTVARLKDAAERLLISKSEVVRKAIADYHQRIGRLSETEKRRLLADFDRLIPQIPDRPTEEVDKELYEIRKARRRTGRKNSGRNRA